MTETWGTTPTVAMAGRSLQSAPPIPVMRPRLPSAHRIGPYLQRIDQVRTYGNYGPLSREFERRVENRLHSPEGTVTTVSNATLGLALALAAQSPKPGTLCIIPAWTFIASAHAAVVAGLVPYFADIDPDSWTLSPSQIDRAIADAPGEVSAVMPVAAFGRPIDIAAWDRFRVRSGLAVVIDAAASFDSLEPGETPTVVSLHATKVLGVGEGGIVATQDTALISDLRARANFGFAGTREAIVAGTNAKLSEYHAAVGLACLDEWETTREEWIQAAKAYRDLLPEAAASLQPGFGEDWISSTCVVTLHHDDADAVACRLSAAQIDTRHWWGAGAHAHAATASYPRAELPVTTRLAQTTIGLPFYRDLSVTNIRHIADLMARSLR